MKISCTNRYTNAPSGFSEERRLLVQTPFVLFAVAKVSTFFKMPNILKEKILKKKMNDELREYEYYEKLKKKFENYNPKEKYEQ